MRIRYREIANAPRAPKRVNAYHGCPMDVARRIVAGEAFRLSANKYDWLGSGAYFWEFAPYRALEWARQRFKENAAVVEATLVLDQCLNLLDSAYFERLEAAYEAVASSFRHGGIVLPENRRGRHLLDRLVVDALCATDAGAGFHAVRGCFPEGDPIYAGSQILQYTHVQIAVRDLSCISSLKLVHSD